MYHALYNIGVQTLCTEAIFKPELKEE